MPECTKLLAQQDVQKLEFRHGIAPGPVQQAITVQIRIASKQLDLAGELLVGPKKTLFLDEISTGLDSSTTFNISRTLREFAHLREATMLVALLQPTPETYNLFDDVMLLSEGQLFILPSSHLCLLSAHTVL